MAFIPPVFNIPFSWWYPGFTPSADPPTATPILGQKYIKPPGPYFSDEGLGGAVFPPVVWIRISIADAVLLRAITTDTLWRGSIWGYTDALTQVRYYGVAWWDIANDSFPNAYVEFASVQCANDGSFPDPTR